MMPNDHARLRISFPNREGERPADKPRARPAPIAEGEVTAAHRAAGRLVREGSDQRGGIAHGDLGLRSWLLLTLLTGLVLVGTSGCNRDVRLSGSKLRSVTVGPTTQYGMVLNKQASPEQVAFVLLRAIADDFSARSEAEREAALDKQFDICAANVIKDRNLTALSPEEFIYTVVHQWTPTVSHYISDFETEWEKAQERFVLRGPRPVKGSGSAAMEFEVLMEIENLGGEQDARVIMVVYLAQDSGLWRVLHLGFDTTRRSIGN